MGTIRDEAYVVYTDGPTVSPDNPQKSEIRRLFATIDERVEEIVTTVAADIAEIEALAASGIRWTTNRIRVRSTGNVNLANGLENGDTLNGVTLATGDHVFLGSQTAPAENGIYTVVASGPASRATFADSAAELANIGFVIQEGTVGIGERWTLPLAAADITVGSTALNFAPHGIEPGYAAELEAARGGEASLSDRLDEIQSSILGATAQAEIVPRAIIDGDIVDFYTYDPDSGKLFSSTTIDGVETRYYEASAEADADIVVSAEYAPRALVSYLGTTYVADTVDVIDGKVVRFQTVDGAVVSLTAAASASGAMPAFSPFESGASPDRDIYLADAVGAFALSAETGDQFSPAMRGDENAVAWVRTWDGTTSRATMPLSFESSLSPNVTKLTAFVFHGQSLNMAANSYPLTHSTAPLAGRAVTFDNGPRLMGMNDLSQVDILATYSGEIGNLIDLKEELDGSVGETVCTQFVKTLEADLAADEGVLCIVPAIGSASYAALKRGTAPWANIANALGRAAFICRQAGIEFEIGGLEWDQGHANAADSAITYRGHMEDLYDDWQDLCAKVTGQTDVPLFLVQCGQGVYSRVALGQWMASTDPTRQIVGVSPHYPFPNTNEQYAIDGKGVNPAVAVDITHLGSTGMARKGDYIARAVTAWRNGNRDELLAPVSAVRSGATVTVSFNTTAPNIVLPLVIDTGGTTGVTISNTSIDGVNGVVWKDAGDGNSVTVSSVSINGSNELVVTLSDTPTGTSQKLQFGVDQTNDAARGQGPTVGARCRIRDSRTSGAITLTGNTYQAPNWMGQSEIAVTV